MMNCKDLLRIINPSILEMYPIVYSMKSDSILTLNMRILAINMIVDGKY